MSESSGAIMFPRGGLRANAEGGSRVRRILGGLITRVKANTERGSIIRANAEAI